MLNLNLNLDLKLKLHKLCKSGREKWIKNVLDIPGKLLYNDGRRYFTMYLKELVEKNGGATVNRKMEVVEFNHGYQVSVRDICGVELKTISPLDLKAMVKTLIPHLADGQYVGLWVDKGICYIDKSELVEELDRAMAIGRRHHQKAIYDWKAKETILIG
jgi:hypothetical protein